jgi:hypothetical protein
MSYISLPMSYISLPMSYNSRLTPYIYRLLRCLFFICFFVERCLSYLFLWFVSNLQHTQVYTTILYSMVKFYLCPLKDNYLLHGGFPLEIFGPFRPSQTQTHKHVFLTLET